MIELLSNRQEAFLVCLGTFVVLFLLFVNDRKEMGQLAAGVVCSFCEAKIAIMLLVMLAYILLEVILLIHLGLWQLSMLVKTIIWLLVPLVSSITAITRDLEKPHYIKHKLFEIVGYTAILEYIVGFKSFDFVIELVLTSLLFIVCIFYISTVNKKEHSRINAGAFKLVISYYLATFVHSLVFLYNEFDFQELKNFLLVVTLSLCFLPFLFFLRLFVVYEDAIALRKLPSIKTVTFWNGLAKAFIKFNANIISHRQWIGSLPRKKIKTSEDFNKSLDCIVKKEAGEKQQYVKFSEGWPEHIIDDFINEFYFENKQSSKDSFILLDEEPVEAEPEPYNQILSQRFTTNGVVTQVQLHFVGLEERRLANDYLNFIEAALVLFKIAFNEELPDSLYQTMRNKHSNFQLINGKEVHVITSPHTRSNGNERIEAFFVIRNLDTVHTLPHFSLVS